MHTRLAGAIVAVSMTSAVTLISVNDEIELGRRAQTEVRAKMPALDDGQVNRYLDGVLGQLVRRAGGPKYPYSISVANYAEINAFALPGGPVWIHRGAIEAAENESQLAGVLGHEIAHIARRHMAKQLTQQLVAGGLLALIDKLLPNDRGGKIGETVAGFAAQSYMLKFSRDEEREADRVGTRMLQDAGWDARGLADFLDVLRAKQGRDPSSVEVFLSSHPGAAERAKALRASGLKAGGRRDSAAFQGIRGRLKEMPPAQKMKKGSVPDPQGLTP